MSPEEAFNNHVDLWECGVCGALVTDADVHTEWHTIYATSHRLLQYTRIAQASGTGQSGIMFRTKETM